VVAHVTSKTKKKTGVFGKSRARERDNRTNHATTT